MAEFTVVNCMPQVKTLHFTYDNTKSQFDRFEMDNCDYHKG